MRYFMWLATFSMLLALGLTAAVPESYDSEEEVVVQAPYAQDDVVIESDASLLEQSRPVRQLLENINVDIVNENGGGYGGGDYSDGGDYGGGVQETNINIERETY